MKHIKNSLIAFVGMLLIVMVGTVLIPVLTRGQKSDPASAIPTLDVKVINNATEPLPIAGTINVVNAGTDPLPVRDMNNPVRTPITFGGQFTVPDGKRLFVEYVSARIETAGPCSVLYAQSTVQLTVTQHYYYPSLVGTYPNSSTYVYGFSQETRLSVDENELAKIEVVGYGCTVTASYPNASGYMVDIP